MLDCGFFFCVESKILKLAASPSSPLLAAASAAGVEVGADAGVSAAGVGHGLELGEVEPPMPDKLCIIVIIESRRYVSCAMRSRIASISFVTSSTVFPRACKGGGDVFPLALY
jgi:hypothetical protein